MATMNINAAPCFNAHLRQWSDEVTLPDGPIELYAPTEDGTEELPPDANPEVEFRGEFPDMMTAIDAIDSTGRFFWSRPDAGRYLGFLNSAPGSVALIVY